MSPKPNLENSVKLEEEDQPHFSYSSRGSSYSAWVKHHRPNMTTQWRQLYLSRAKLKAVSRTSALIAGFAMVAMVEVQLDRSVVYDQVLLILFSTVTTCLVAVHLFALMIATCMLPNIEAVSNIHNVKAIEQSPHHKMRTYIEVAWILSTGIGLILFLIEIALLIWLKFMTLSHEDLSSPTPSPTITSLVTEVTLIRETVSSPTSSPTSDARVPAYCATAVLVPVVILFAGFAIHFYRTLAQHRYTIFKDAFDELENMAQADDTMAHLHPNSVFTDGGIHLAVSRMHSGASIQSQTGVIIHKPSLREDLPRHSRSSSPADQYPTDPI